MDIVEKLCLAILLGAILIVGIYVALLLVGPVVD